MSSVGLLNTTVSTRLVTPLQCQGTLNTSLSQSMGIVPHVCPKKRRITCTGDANTAPGGKETFPPGAGYFRRIDPLFFCAQGPFSMAEPLFESLIAIVSQPGQVSPASQTPDIGQRHSVEGVVLAGGIDRHIAEEHQIPLFQRTRKRIVADHIAGRASGAGQPKNVALSGSVLAL